MLFPSPGDLRDPGTKPALPAPPASAGGFVASEPPGKPLLSFLASKTDFFLPLVFESSALVSKLFQFFYLTVTLTVEQRNASLLRNCSSAQSVGVLVIFCCVTNDHKLRDLQLHGLSQFRVSVTTEREHLGYLTVFQWASHAEVEGSAGQLPPPKVLLIQDLNARAPHTLPWIKRI